MDRLQFRLQEHKLDLTIFALVKLESELNQMLDLIQDQHKILTTPSI